MFTAGYTDAGIDECLRVKDSVPPRETSEPVTLPETLPPTEPTTVPTEPTTIPTEPPLILHSGLREDGSFDEGTWFIGDSLSLLFLNHYLKPQEKLGDAKYTTIAGSHLTVFMDGQTRIQCRAGNTLASEEFDGMLFTEVADTLGESATAIYIMWGTNFTREASADSYIEIVDYLLEHCPNATVHLQLVSYANPMIVPYEVINERISDAFEYYQSIGEERVLLIDTFTAIGQNTISDGVHQSDKGRENWYQALLDHAKNNQLPQ